MPGNRVVGPGRRCGNTHVELDDGALEREACHRVGAHDRFFNMRLVAPQVVLVPLVAKFLLDFKIREFEVVRRTFDLDVAAGAEIELLALGQGQHELLDEACDVAVGDDRGLPALDAEDFVGNLHVHVLLDRHLAGQTVMLGRIPLVDRRRLGRQDRATTRQHAHAALAAGAAATAGRRDEELVVGKHLEQLAAGLDRQFLFIVNDDIDVAGCNQLRASNQNDEDQYQYDGRKQANAQKYFL